MARGAGATKGSGSPWRRAWIGTGLLIAAGLALASCSLGNIVYDDCTSDAQCATAFGAGSRCETGFCTPAGGSSGCEKKAADGHACFSCAPKTTTDFENACTDASCAPFDDAARLTKLTADGGLPPLPPKL